ncbi:MATE family efflux transporter [Pseudoruegeria sp. SK021]|uniref:MATE family efflux transporter n=1 Tax=Pseudoruegeria sp. SK021 TaxID=1933035 RepID=UPI000A25E898|nr:MATE family efflux transporter [Pseudoruegeria sp. SK021]OSP54527.1 MATE family efflux transporter [Pseudoruegeria sp. SK021]
MVQTKSLWSHMAAILTLGLPLIGSQLAQFLITLTDTVMIGWYGVPELAALVVATSILFTMILLGSGFAFAVMPLVAAAAAVGDVVQIRRVTRMGLWASMGFAALVVPVLIMWRSLFAALGQPDQVAILAGDYIRVAAWGLPAALIFMVLRSYLAALEQTRVVMVVTLASAVLNAGLNYVLIFGRLGLPELGVQGAAVATVGTNLMGAATLGAYAAWKHPDHAIFVRLWRPDWVGLGRVFRLGWPIGLTLLAEVGMFSASAVMVGWVGVVPLAAHGIVLQLATATFMVHLGLSQAATIRAASAYGRSDGALLRRDGTAGLILSLLVSFVTVVVFLLVPEPLILVFLDASDPLKDQILATGVTLMVLAALFQLSDGAQVMVLALLRGVQDTRVPMIFAAVSYWGVGVPVAYVLGFVLEMGAAGVWLGLLAGLVMAAALMLHRFWLRILPSVEVGRG